MEVTLENVAQILREDFDLPVELKDDLITIQLVLTSQIVEVHFLLKEQREHPQIPRQQLIFEFWFFNDSEEPMNFERYPSDEFKRICEKVVEKQVTIGRLDPVIIDKNQTFLRLVAAVSVTHATLDAERNNPDNGALYQAFDSLLSEYIKIQPLFACVETATIDVLAYEAAILDEPVGMSC